MNPRGKKKNGFTILEVVIVLSILTIVAAIGIFTMAQQRDYNHVSSDVVELKQTLMQTKYLNLTQQQRYGFILYQNSSCGQRQGIDFYFVFLDQNDDGQFTDDDNDPCNNFSNPASTVAPPYDPIYLNDVHILDQFRGQGGMANQFVCVFGDPNRTPNTPITIFFNAVGGVTIGGANRGGTILLQRTLPASESRTGSDVAYKGGVIIHAATGMVDILETRLFPMEQAQWCSF